VKFGKKAVTTFISTDTQIVVASPAGAAGKVHVAVVTAAGTSRSSAADLFRYLAAPRVASVRPQVGPCSGGTKVTITGKNLANATQVRFGANPATILGNTATKIVAVSPAAPSNETYLAGLHVTTAGGMSPHTPTSYFNYVAAPMVSSVSPASGPLTGGTQVTITGTDLTRATAVRFGTAPAKIKSKSDTSIVVISPKGAAGTVDVTVTSAGGTSAISPADQFTYVAARAVVDLSPTLRTSVGGLGLAAHSLSDRAAIAPAANDAAILAILDEADTTRPQSGEFATAASPVISLPTDSGESLATASRETPRPIGSTSNQSVGKRMRHQKSVLATHPIPVLGLSSSLD
jgi:hypothetical protein